MATKSQRNKLYIKETIFDNVNRRIILKGIKGNMIINSSDMANDFVSFVISVTNEPMPFTDNTEDDTEYYMNNLLWSAQAILNNGRLITNGNFAISDFTINKESKDNNYISVEMNRDEMIIPIPEGYNMDALVLNNGSDAGNLGFGISEKFEIKNVAQSITLREPLILADKFEFINYPNPVKDKLSIQIELKEASDIKVLLFDISGNLEQSIYEGYFKGGKALRIEHSLRMLNQKRYTFLNS